MSKFLPLENSKDLCLVDDDDFVTLSKYTWNVCYNTRSKYIMLGKDRAKLIHRIILNPPKGAVIDHINGDYLDNRKCNLRICTTQQNNFNSKKRKHTSSKFKGVSWDKERNKWVAHIKINKITQKLGRFNSEIEAAKAYNEKALTLFGEYANLNKIEEN